VNGIGSDAPISLIKFLIVPENSAAFFEIINVLPSELIKLIVSSCIAAEEIFSNAKNRKKIFLNTRPLNLLFHYVKVDLFLSMLQVKINADK
jgi:hypothetical protein